MGFEIDKNNDGFDLIDDFNYSTKIMVFGVGGAGGNAVGHMVEASIGDVEYVIANTDVAALRKKDGSLMKRIQLGRKLTKGQGAGNDPTKGQEAAVETSEEIAKCFEGVSMLFVAAGMGGGTGTGAAPVVAQLAKEKGILTVGVVTKPFDWEGVNKMQMAVKGISEMKKNVDALIVIPNDRVRMLKGANISFMNAFVKVDEILCKAVTGIITLLRGDGYINVDFADICATLRESGIAHMAIGSGKGENRIDDALEEVLNSPLLETSITGAKRGLLNISVSGPDSMSLEEFDQLNKKLAEKFNPNARYKIGVEFDSNLADDELSIIAVATDFEESSVKQPAAAQQVKKSAPAEVRQTDDAAQETSEPQENSSSGLGFGFSESQDIDTLLRKFNQGREN